MREVLQRARVQYQAGKLRADAAVGGARGNSRLHLHPRRHLQRSGHALRASGHHHRSALTTLACGDRISRSARRIAESTPVAGKIGGHSTCFDARPSSPELRLACTGAHSCGESLDSVYTGVPTRAERLSFGTKKGPPCDRNRSENDTNRIDALMRAHGGLGSLVRPPASCLEWCGA